METLDQLRSDWEKGSTPLFHFGDAMEKLTIAKTKSGKFDCYRYFLMSRIQQNTSQWVVSVDHRGISIEESLKWVEDHLDGMIPQSKVN